jgi:cell wall assembly regulator SMI1
MTTREAIMLEHILKEIEVSLKENFKDVYDSLMPGATEIQLNLLEKKCFGGSTIPEDLKLLYKWNDG